MFGLKFLNIILILLFIDRFNIGNCYLCFNKHGKEIISLYIYNNILHQYTFDGSIKTYQLWKIVSNPNIHKHTFYVDKFLRKDHIKNILPGYKDMKIFSLASINIINITTRYLFMGVFSNKTKVNKTKNIFIKKDSKIKVAIPISSQLEPNDEWPIVLLQYDKFLNINLTLAKYPSIIIRPLLFLCVYAQDSQARKIIQVEKQGNCKEKHLNFNLMKTFLFGFRSGFIYNNYVYLLSFGTNRIISFDYDKLKKFDYTILLEDKITNVFLCKSNNVETSKSKFWIYFLTIIIIVMLILIFAMNCGTGNNIEQLLINTYRQKINNRKSWLNNWNWMQSSQFWSKNFSRYNTQSKFSKITSKLKPSSYPKSKKFYFKRLSEKMKSVGYQSSPKTGNSRYSMV